MPSGSARRAPQAEAKAGAVAIECSTVSYRHALELARELRGRGLVYIDSPVTGLPDAAASGKLTLLVGAEPADLERARPYLAPLSDDHPAFRRRRHRHGVQADQQSDGGDPDCRARRGPCDRRAGRSRHEAGAGVDRTRRGREPAGAAPFQTHGGARFRRRELHRRAAAQGCRLRGCAGRELLAEPPLVGRAAVQAYAKAKAHAPDDDEGKDDRDHVAPRAAAT